jgi:hypothetical protein
MVEMGDFAFFADNWMVKKEWLVSHWKFDEGQGSIAYDSMGNNHGTIYGATWTTGQFNSALSFDGTNDYVDMADTVQNYLETIYTVSTWIKANTLISNKAISAYRHTVDIPPVLFQIGHNYKDLAFNVRDNSLNLATATYANVLATNTWFHVAGVREENILNVYVNGVSGIPGSAMIGAISPDNLKIGALHFGGNPPSNYFDGTIDDVIIFDRALSAEEIWEIFRTGMSKKAFAPCPADGATYVDPNVVLTWTPGKGALSHDVYFSTSYDDVNDANTLSDEYKGNYDVNSYDPCGLDFETTYYWRIDEVGDSNTYKGDVWSFKTWTDTSLYCVSWWKFDEGQGTIAYDSAGMHDGIIYGATWTTGQFNSALDFDGINDYVDMADTVKNYLETSYTVSAWIKTNTVSAIDAFSIITYRHSTEINPVLFTLGQYNADISFAVRDNAHNLAQPVYTNALTTNAWYHVAGVREGNVLNVYVNGVSGIPASATFGEISPDNLKIGALHFGGNPVSNYFDGTIDDVKILNIALSASKIQQLHYDSLVGW